MADKDAKTADDKSAKKTKEDPAPALAAPDIHFLQAERATLQSNRDALTGTPATDAEVAEIDKKIAAIDKQLAG